MKQFVGTDFKQIVAQGSLKQTINNQAQHNYPVRISKKRIFKLISPKAFLKELLIWFVILLLELYNLLLLAILTVEKLAIKLRDFVFQNLFWGRTSETFMFLRSILLIISVLGGVMFLLGSITSSTSKINQYKQVKTQAMYASAIQAEDAVVSTVSLETLVQTKGYLYETRYYVVHKGDTLSTIARKYSVSTDTIKWANNLKSSTLRIGQKLLIPPGSGLLYTVKKGDTIAGLAKKYKAAPQAIMEANFLDRTSDLQIGSLIFIPDGTLPEPAKPKYVASRPKSRSGVRTVPGVRPGSRPPVYTGGGSYKRFLIWPVEGTGTLTQRYSYHHKALDIANNGYTRSKYGGHPYILAAASGRVTFAGHVCNAYRCGYAYMINIDHGNGYSTLYAHLHPGSLMVHKGQYVRRGQRIARMGQSGWTYGIHVHFEVSRGNYGSRRSLYNPLLFMK